MAFRARKVFGSFEKRTPGFCDEYPRDVVKPARLRNDVKNSKCSLECKNLSIYRSITEPYFSYCCIAWDTEDDTQMVICKNYKTEWHVLQLLPPT